ncbi:MAG: beta-lactamase family protein [Fimbriimonadaceae bacterium]|nr:beta-lactamase family protein [Chthonomonadaceae bacterium]MCO5297396.1 beta-lactamase family protein [Fimbriimonadaceae bacterium]
MGSIACLLACACAVAPAQTPIQAGEAKVAALLGSLREARGFPGATVGVVTRDGQSFTVSVGVSDERTGRKLIPTDRMLAGSIGKTFLGALVLREVEAGRLSLDQKAAYWLGSQPWFKGIPNAGRITLEQLMHHTSGIPEHVEDPAFVAEAEAHPDRVWTTPERVAYISGRPPLAPPGERFSYADTNYILLGEIYQEETGREFYGDARALLRSLHLEGIIPSDRRRLERLIPGHARPIPPFSQQGPTLVDGVCRLNPQLEWTGGGFASTALDLARWALAYFGGDVVSPAMRAKLFEGVKANTGPNEQYGLGVQIRETKWGRSYGHGGWFPGYLSEMEYYPDLGLAVAVQFNTDDGRRIGARTHGVIEQIVGVLAPIPPPERQGG